MTQRESDAEYYQKNKDADDWGDPVESSVKPTSQPGAMISVRFTHEEVQRIRSKAKIAGESVSRYIRKCVLKDSAKTLTPTRNGAIGKSLASQYSFTIEPSQYSKSAVATEFHTVKTAA
ncbi:MAG: hypothetical protein WDO06_03220 [Actinomycetota bacterium]